MQRARIVHEQFAAKVDRVASGSNCQPEEWIQTDSRSLLRQLGAEGR
jgi:hypothetical protein